MLGPNGRAGYAKGRGAMPAAAPPIEVLNVAVARATRGHLRPWPYTCVSRSLSRSLRTGPTSSGLGSHLPVLRGMVSLSAARW